MDRNAQFEELRPLLFSLAYRMLGTRADAEDIVQEAFLRWQGAAAEEVRSAKSYLTTVVARLSLDELKSAKHNREVYVGPWLPEPIVEPLGTDRVEMAESLSLAFLRLLESLTPAERIAFLLREIFEMPYSEVASVLETSEVNCRQITQRARKHIQDKRPRFSVDRERHLGLLQRFLAACSSGDSSQLMTMLREDAVLFSDSGGKAPAARNPIVSAEFISRFFSGLVKKGALSHTHAEFVYVNGELGTLIYRGEHLEAVVALQLDEEERIANIFLISNPDKLPKAVG